MSSFWVGKNVRLRPFTSEDWQTMLRWGEESASIRNLEMIRPPFNEQVAQQRMSALAGCDNEGSDAVTLVIETLEGEVIGTVGGQKVDRRNGVFYPSLGIAEPRYQRKGLGGEALALILRYYFGELNYQKCQAIVYSFNDKSLEFCRKFGFVDEGRMRSTVYSHGQYYDGCIVGLTKNEFFTHVLPRFEENWPYRYGEEH